MGEDYVFRRADFGSLNNRACQITPNVNVETGKGLGGGRRRRREIFFVKISDNATPTFDVS